MKGIFMENPTLNQYFKNKEDWESYISQFNVRKIINKFDKAFIQKVKRYYKTYGFDMILYEDQKKRMDLILRDINIEKLKTYKPGDKFRDGICTYVKHSGRDEYLMTMDGEEVEKRFTEDGIIYYEKDGQRYYAIYA